MLERETLEKIKNFLGELIAGLILFGIPIWMIFQELFKELALYE